MKTNLPGQNVPIMLADGQMNPVWYQALKSIEGLTGLLAANSLYGNPTGAPGPAIGVPLGAGLSFSGGSLIGSSINGLNGAFLLGANLSLAGMTINAGASLSYLQSTLTAGNVALNNTANFFDIVSVAQGSSGTWLAIAFATTFDGTAGNISYQSRLTDGTTIFANGPFTAPNSGNGHVCVVGVISNPAGNIKLQLRDSSSVNGAAINNQCQIVALRIA